MSGRWPRGGAANCTGRIWWLIGCSCLVAILLTPLATCPLSDLSTALRAIRVRVYKLSAEVLADELASEFVEEGETVASFLAFLDLDLLGIGLLDGLSALPVDPVLLTTVGQHHGYHWFFCHLPFH